jgi:hypothetical protein
MKCRQARQQCAVDDHYSLAETRQAALRAHLSGCPGCRRAEQEYRDIVSALRSLPADVPRTDLLAQAVAQYSLEARGASTSRWSTPWGRTAAAAAATVLVVSCALMTLRPRTALGQTALRRVQASILRAKTMHQTAWLYLPNEEEARTGTWHDGKKPLRTETWLTREAMSGSDDLLGPYLWTAKGYLHYDSGARRVNLNEHIGIEMPLKSAIQSAFDPVAGMRKAAPAGSCLSVKRLGDAQWHGVKVYKLQVASSPVKPAPDEQVPADPEPGATPPLSSAPHVRETFWVDKATDLPVYSEFEKQIQLRWTLRRRSEYEYNRPAPPSQFDPEAVRQAAEAFAAAKQKRR